LVGAPPRGVFDMKWKIARLKTPLFLLCS